MLRVTPRLPVADLSRTIAFYTELLGFKAGPPWPEEAPRWVLLGRDEVGLQFYVPDAEPPQPCGNGTIYLEVEDARPFHAALRDRVTIDWGPEVYWYGRREFSFKDPDGYSIIVSAQTDDPVECRDGA
jgi:catechol 2,3-dioxygenase-like lactoylglutathione lyase family enzyme